MSWRVLLTRPRADSEAFASSLRDAGIGIPVLVAPVIDIEAARTLPDLDAYLAIVVTSANAVRALGAGLSGKTVLAVGPQTALAARALGASAVSADGDAADLAALIAARPPRGKLLYARGNEVRTDLAATLRNAGAEIDEAVVYRQVDMALGEADRREVMQGGPLIVPLFSPRSARALARQGLSLPKGSIVAALSPDVAAAWPGPESKAVASAPNRAQMIDMIGRLLRHHGRLEP